MPDYATLALHGDPLTPEEMDELPLKDAVRKKWMYDNAARMLGLS